MAKHKIIVSEGVTLLYPSVLSLVEHQSFDQNSLVSIGKDSRIIGSVFLHSLINDFRKDVHLDIAENAEIHGLVYSNGSVQLKGTVNGSLMTKKIAFKNGVICLRKSFVECNYNRQTSR